VLSPINLADKPLTLRAGAGAWPVLSLAPEAVAADLPLLTTRAALTLEGLEFHREGGGKPGATGVAHIHSLRAPLAVANCRFVRPQSKNPRPPALVASYSPDFQIRNCQFLGDWFCGLDSLWMVADGRAIVANCLFLTVSHALTFHIQEDTPTASMQVLNNTMISHGQPIAISFKAGQSLKNVSPPLRLEARRNIGATGLLNFLCYSQSKDDDDVLEGELRSLPARLVALEDQGNHVAAGSPFVTFRLLPLAGGERLKPAIASVEEYQNFWKLGETGSILAPIRFHKGLSPTTLTPEKLSPQDFRVEAHGPDLEGAGADVDLVGPGPAYERWKATPAYQEWLKAVGQAP
jgi:hypothetical protein